MKDLLKKALAAHQVGNLSEAEKLYRSLLASQPDQLDAVALLGVVCGTQGKHEEAASLIENAITRDSKSALFRFYYGNVLMNARRMPEAIRAFRDAIALQPSLAEAHFNLANTLRAEGDWPGAVKSYQTAIVKRPNYPEALNNLALCLVHEKDYPDGLRAAQEAVRLAPHYGDGWVTICNVAEKLKDYKLALDAGKRAIELHPGNHFSWFGYGVVLNRLDRHEEAIVAYQRALELKPDRADIWDNLGQTYQSLNRLEEAEATYRKTIEVDHQSIVDEAEREVTEEEYGNRHWHLALMELLRGNYASGFARYRARFKDVGGLTRPTNFSRPLWRGESLNGKKILILDEQGFGDTLMLARYLPLVKARGAHIIFSVHAVLKPLFDDWTAVDQVIVHGTQVVDYDYFASVFDLPYIFKTTIETIPNTFPYLPLLKPTSETTLDPDSKIKIGVVWGGNPLHLNDIRRSVPLTLFTQIFSESRFHFYDFNRDKKAGDAEYLARFAVTDLASRIKNFADSARFVNQMDLLITCDTSTAHLAGGLGKPVWVLLPFAPDWRWLTGRRDSVWYPSALLFRQKHVNGWATVIADVTQTLQQLT